MCIDLLLNAYTIQEGSTSWALFAREYDALVVPIRSSDTGTNQVLCGMQKTKVRVPQTQKGDCIRLQTEI